MTDTLILLAPHADDESIFAAFTCLQHQPHVLVCLAPRTNAGERDREHLDAVDVLGCTSGRGPCIQGISDADDLREWLSNYHRAERVFAPAVEEDGHPDHNLVGQVAQELFGERVTSYLTYTRSGGRSRWGTLVEPEPEWIALKHRALACYESQIRDPTTRPWFIGDLSEYVVA